MPEHAFNKVTTAKSANFFFQSSFLTEHLQVNFFRTPFFLQLSETTDRDKCPGLFLTISAWVIELLNRHNVEVQ